MEASWAFRERECAQKEWILVENIGNNWIFNINCGVD